MTKCLLNIVGADVREDRIWSDGQPEPWEGALNINNNTIKAQVVHQWTRIKLLQEARGQERSYAVDQIGIDGNTLLHERRKTDLK